MPYTRPDIFEFVPDHAPDGRWAVVKAATGQVIAYAADQESAELLAVRFSVHGARQRMLEAGGAQR
jgi:hypothetical protein